ncbi:LysR family transcriptional regulator, partial [Rhizobium leguminosarum]
IKDHECLCYNRAGEANTWSFSNCSEDISVRISPRLTSCNAVAIHRAALAGAGLSVLSHIDGSCPIAPVRKSRTVLT